MTLFCEILYRIGVLIACGIAIRAQWRQFAQNVDQWDAKTNPPSPKDGWRADLAVLIIALCSYCVIYTIAVTLDFR